ncbi:unnamed protein product [Rotaria magnacalcarata]
MLIQSFPHNAAIHASMHFSFRACFVKHNDQSPQFNIKQIVFVETIHGNELWRLISDILDNPVRQAP